MGRRDDKNRRAARKLRNANRSVPRDAEPRDRSRQVFFWRFRSGDAAVLHLTFSGIPVPFDESDPTKVVVLKTLLVRAAEDKAVRH